MIRMFKLCGNSVKDPVLPKMQCGLKIDFVLCENDFGLAIGSLYCPFNLQMSVVMPLLLNSNNNRTFLKITAG